MEDLQASFPGRIRAAVVYITDAHPADAGPTAAELALRNNVPTGHGAAAAPRSLAEHLALARVFRQQ